MEHTLADEIDAWSIDIIRAFFLVDRAIEALADVHPALVPANIVIDGDTVRLVETAPAEPPYIAPDGTLTEKSNVYSLAAILQALLGRRADMVRDMLELARHFDPRRRPTLDAFRGRLRASGWDHHRMGTWHRRFVPAPTEYALVNALRDDGGRDVYADWLEQHGADERAMYLRSGAPAPAADARWRAIVSDARLDNCFNTACPKRWAALAPTELDNVRDCGTCRRQVYYCTSLATVQNEARRSVPIAIDAALGDADVSRMLVTMHVPTYVPLPALR